jgi:hypothetical protein
VAAKERHNRSVIADHTAPLPATSVKINYRLDAVYSAAPSRFHATHLRQPPPQPREIRQ